MGNKPIVHAPIATGSTEPRDIRDRFADFVNLKDFGAKGDGVTDDSTAWAAWQTALQSGGMPYIPSGNYLLDEEIVHAPKGHLGRNVSLFSFEDDGPILDVFSSPVYLDTTGDDANDGISSSTAVQTFTKALEIASAMPRQKAKLIVSGGTYSGDVTVSSSVIEIALLGNVTINGSFSITDVSTVFVTGENYSLTVNSAGKNGIDIFRKSFAVFFCDVYVYVSNTQCGVRSTDISHILFTKLLTVTSNDNNVVDACACGYNAEFEVWSSVSINGAFFRYIYAHENGIFFSDGVTTSNNVCRYGLRSQGCGKIIIYGDITIYAQSCIDLTEQSYCNIKANNIKLTANASSGKCIRSAYTSITCFSSPDTGSIAISLDIGSSGARCLECTDFGIIDFSNVSSVKFSGTGTVNAYSSSFGNLYFPGNITVSGSFTGKRYQVGTLSLIATSGAGANRFPGTTAGTVNSSYYGAYV